MTRLLPSWLVEKVPRDHREFAREAMRLAGHKLPVRTKFVTREGAPQ